MSLKESLRKFLGRHRRGKLVGKIGRNLGYLWQGFENQDYDIATNGEKFVVQSVARITPAALIFDVGAHQGDWAKMAATALPKGRIHSFEVIPATFKKLQHAAKGLPAVSPHNLGLGEKAGTLEFSLVAGRDELSSGVAGVHGELHKFEFQNVTCPIMPGDQFCAEQGIDRIHLLKIDVEGMEPQVMRGFARMFAEGRIDAVQFEYGQINLRSRFFLGDFYALLGGYDMMVGKVYPNYVDFQDYHFTQDMLLGPNFLAVRRGCGDLIQVLRG